MSRRNQPRGSTPASRQMFSFPKRSSSELNIAHGWMSEIARAHKVHRSLVSNVLAGRDTSAPVARSIAAALGKTHAELWPGKYPEAEFLEAMAAHKGEQA